MTISPVAMCLWFNFVVFVVVVVLLARLLMMPIVVVINTFYISCNHSDHLLPYYDNVMGKILYSSMCARLASHAVSTK